MISPKNDLGKKVLLKICGNRGDNVWQDINRDWDLIPCFFVEDIRKGIPFGIQIHSTQGIFRIDKPR